MTFLKSQHHAFFEDFQSGVKIDCLLVESIQIVNKRFSFQRFLDQYVLNNSFVRAQDASSVIQSLCFNEYARDITWDYLRSKWDDIYNM